MVQNTSGFLAPQEGTIIQQTDGSSFLREKNAFGGVVVALYS